jgi:metal-sulfur cluster biosynthetic enzyme
MFVIIVDYIYQLGIVYRVHIHPKTTATFGAELFCNLNEAIMYLILYKFISVPGGDNNFKLG